MTTGKDNIRLAENMLRNIVRNTIKEALTERFEAAKDPKVEELCRNLFKKLHIEKQHNDKFSPKRRQRVLIATEYSDYGSIRIYIDTQLPNDFIRYNGSWQDQSKAIVITFNEMILDNYVEFRNALMHEITHCLDSKHYNIYTGNYDATLYGFLQNVQGNPLQSIIYRLWTPTERNAYTIYAYQRDLTHLKKYIQRLEDMIDAVDKDPERYANGRFWVKYIAPILLGKKYSSDDKWPLAKDFFIKKSRMLLERFKKKALQRYGQHYNDHGEEYQPDMNDVKYQAVNYDVINQISSRFMNDIMYLTKSDSDYQTWVEYWKKEYPRITNKLLKYVWNREFPKLMNMFAEEPSYYQKYLDWAKRHGYYNEPNSPS